MANIYIHKDEVYRTRVEDVTDSSLFFYPVYEQARTCLEAMVNYTNRYWDEQNGTARNLTDEERFNPIRMRGYPNNIIAFNGDRGYGKTSAMLSFSAGLQAIGPLSGEDTHNQVFIKDRNFWSESVRKLHFFALEPIDPTLLENKDSILPVIISRMFTHFVAHARYLRNPPACQPRPYDRQDNSYSRQNNRDNPYVQQNLRDQQQQLLQMFENCYRLADDRKDSKRHTDSYDDLQALAERSDVTNLKERFNELVHCYLEFMCLDPSRHTLSSSRNAYLILQIDDADMNPGHAYDVVEDIRKYCVLPNVIILFATNMKQLEMCVEQHFVKSFETISKATVKDDPSSMHTAAYSIQQCRSTAVNYLDKLVPSLHRINLPNINDALQNYGNHVGLYHSEFHTKEQRENPESYQIAIAAILEKKCLLDIYPHENRLHPFLPKQMRELSHFLNRLSTMPNVMLDPDGNPIRNPRRELMKWAVGISGIRDYSTDAQDLKKNLEALMDYLVYDWAEMRLKSWQMDTLQEIHRVNAERKIAIALEVMCQKYFRYLANSKRPTAYSWEELLDMIRNLNKSQDQEFSSALELYFQMYKELLFVCDCISK